MQVRQRIRRQKTILYRLKRRHLRKFPDVGIIDSDDDAWTSMTGLRPKVKTTKYFIANRPGAAAGATAAEDHLATIADPDNPTDADNAAAKTVGQAAAD